MNRLRSPWLLVAAALAAAPAAADWLVMKDGGRIETKGSWKVEGRRVLFTQTNGTLSALRLDEVDLDQSAAVTAAEVEAGLKAAEPAPEAPARRAPVLRMTQEDFPPSPEAGEEGDTVSAPGAEAAPGADLSVASWEKIQNASADGVEIFGTIRNSGRNNVTSPSIMIMIYGQDGGLLATNEGTINAGMIAPGQSANFRVAFPGVPDFGSVKFDVQGRGFRARPGEAGEGDAVEEEAPAEGGA